MSTWEKELKLLLVEDGDKPAGDDVVEALEEGGELLPDGAGHLHLANQPHVVVLVLISHLHETHGQGQDHDMSHVMSCHVMSCQKNFIIIIYYDFLY